MTPRQIEILSLVCFTNQQIARQLGVTMPAVRNQFYAIYKRLGLDNGDSSNMKRIRAVTKALRLGLLALDDLSEGDRVPLVRRRGQAPVERRVGSVQPALWVGRQDG